MSSIAARVEESHNTEEDEEAMANKPVVKGKKKIRSRGLAKALSALGIAAVAIGGAIKGLQEMPQDQCPVAKMFTEKIHQEIKEAK